MAAAGSKTMSESWAKSESSGQATGSIYASTILQSAIQMQIATKEGVESQEDIETSPSYVGWAKFIHDIGSNQVDRMFWRHKIEFSAQDYLWGSNHESVSNLPMVDYKSKWEMLKVIPIDTANPMRNRAPNANVGGSMASLGVGEYGSTTLGQAFPGNFTNIVAEQARQYLMSFPGNDASGSNPQHSWFRRIARGQITDSEHLEILSDELCYRNALTGVATRYKAFLELQMEDAHLFDTWAWVQEQEPNEQWDRFSKIHDAIHDASIFGHPAPSQGFFFAKPTEYLAIAFVKSGRSMEQVLAEIKKLAAFRGVMVSFVQKPILDNPEVQRRNNRFFRTFTRLGQRLRSLSPGKNKEKTPKKEREKNNGEASGSNRF
ncbi:hypothetical protein GMDG_00610 [Pseudogymnoascus destructans 20631-21]|uniref:Uncharacterized protein n=2 Tax=Pseudogymnoascus destructans TaxID=655981 RepID=L8G7A0_PSED2|nr:hypothetical protein GMDG_00610 [Pseudogymnoascus destructans 20631-21]